MNGTKSITLTNQLILATSNSLYNPEFPLVINSFEKFNQNLYC